ncbi:hypothetical protein ACVWZ8_002902 [Arthrobacter sp. UYCu723]
MPTILRRADSTSTHTVPLLRKQAAKWNGSFWQ